MDIEQIESLRERHAAWRLLRADNAALVLSFLGRFFVEENRGATAAGEVAAALEDELYAANAARPRDDVALRYPRSPRAYLEDWAATEVGYLRRFYPVGTDEVHYEVTPAFEKAYSWVQGLPARSFVGTESRLHIVVDLLRQMVHGSQSDPGARLEELQRRRAEIDGEIAAVEAGDVAVLDATAIRDRYQQFSTTARELLSDFREVEDNFRGLDRAARERIAAWEGAKGELLADLVGSRSDIAGSDQGRSFQSFYDFLLSQRRQDELAELLQRVAALDAVEVDPGVRGIQHNWAEAAERTQRTVRTISEQLRRFLDDQVWVENRRVLDLVRAVETAALAIREQGPTCGLEVDTPGVAIALPFDRPLYDARPVTSVESLIPPDTEEPLDTDLLFEQTFVDQARLATNIRTVVPERSTALLEDIVQFFPITQGAAEIVSYLSLQDDDLDIDMDDTQESLIDYSDESGHERRARLPRVTVRRR